mmetsp:Transcript_2420/g.3518  ORF Transcript_2420/g.3518 Transcript_2420/m.3518 type:complete len:916 (+) Transcript_2420:18-2765(+)
MSLHERNESFHSDIESYLNKYNNGSEVSIRPTISEYDSEDDRSQIQANSTSFFKRLSTYFKRKTRSISTVIILSMSIIASVSIFISVTWLLIVLLQTKSNLPESTKLDYTNARNRIKYYFSIPALASSNLGALFISLYTFHNDTSYKYVQNVFVPLVKMHVTNTYFKGYFYYKLNNESMAFFVQSSMAGSTKKDVYHVLQWGNDSSITLPSFEPYKTNAYAISSLKPFQVVEDTHTVIDINLNDLYSNINVDNDYNYHHSPIVSECFSNLCTLSMPFIVKPNENFTLIVSIDLKHLQDGISEYKGTYNSFVLIFEPVTNSYVASSNKTAMQLLNNKPVRILDHPDSYIREIAQILENNYGSTMKNLTHKIDQIAVYIGCTKYYIESSKIIFEGVEMVLVLKTSEFEYYFASFIAGIVLISISVISILFAIAFGSCTSKVILKPVQTLITNMKQISDGFNFETIRLGKTPYFTELCVLEEVFCALMEKLMLYRTFLPEHIIKNVDSYKSALQSLSNVMESEAVESASFVSVSQLVNPVNSTTSNKMATGNSVSETNDGQSEMHQFETKLKKQLLKSPSLDLGISREKATYLSISIEFCEKKSVDINMMVYSNIMNCVSKTVAFFNGAVELFDEKSILIGFNSMTPSAGHVRHACYAALKIANQIQMFPNYAQSTSGGFKIGIGLSTGFIHKGTIGSSLKRTWKSLGKPVTMAHYIAKHSLYLGVHIIFDYEVRQHISRPTLQFRCIDIIIPRQHETKKHFLYELSLVSLERSQESFAISMQSIPSFTTRRSTIEIDHWAHDYRVAFSHLLENEIADARTKMNGYLQKNTEDHIAEQLLGIMDYIHRTSSTFDIFTEKCTETLDFSIAGISYFSILHHKSHHQWNNHRFKEHTSIEPLTPPSSTTLIEEFPESLNQS